MNKELTHLRMNTNEFKNYIKTNEDTIFIITVCSCNIDLKKGSFTRALLWNGKKKINTESVDNVTSSNKCALYGLLDGVKSINKAKSVALVSSTALGFSKCEKGKGVNSDICNQILSELREKGCDDITDIMVKDGTSYLKEICGIAYENHIVKTSNNVNVIKLYLNEEQTKGLERNAARLNIEVERLIKSLIDEYIDEN